LAEQKATAPAKKRQGASAREATGDAPVAIALT
jgi:hypothetical protein